MNLSATLSGKTYTFASVKEVLAKANEEKSGDRLAGIAAQGFGICIVSGSDMVFPAPDELNQTIARTSGRKLSNVKIFMDILYVVIAIIMNLITMHSIVSIGISSVVSALLTGHFIRLFNKILPGAQLGPVVSE